MKLRVIYSTREKSAEKAAYFVKILQKWVLETSVLFEYLPLVKIGSKEVPPVKAHPAIPSHHEFVLKFKDPKKITTLKQDIAFLKENGVSLEKM